MIDFDSYLQLSLIFLHLVTSSREFRILAALNLELYHCKLLLKEETITGEFQFRLNFFHW